MRTFLLLAVAAGLAAGADIASGIFTQAQVDAGRALADLTCSQCHTPALTGRKNQGELPLLTSLKPGYQSFVGKAGIVPPLVGPVFVQHMESKTLPELVRFLQSALTTFLPDRTDEESGLNVTAYILMKNGLKPGTQPLTMSSTTLVRSVLPPPMIAPEQNKLVATYCAICHTDASKNGGLSLEHFDAAHTQPQVAAMIVSKLKGGALGAAGLKLPDKETQANFQTALEAESVGFERWSVVNDATTLTVGRVRAVPSTAKDNKGGDDLYWLTMTCDGSTHKGEMQLAWSPGVPKQGVKMLAAVDGRAPQSYTIEGTEKMGNGQSGDSGPGAILLTSTPVPEHSLTITQVFPDETAVFDFEDLSAVNRKALSACFGAAN